MAEEDEVDIIGDYSLDSFLPENDALFDSSDSLVSQNLELLKCDYTVHPQWLLDKPSANPACWYTNTPSLELDISTLETEPQISSNNKTDDEWTEKEKNLLNRGIDIFGKSNARLAQFIGSKTTLQVKHYLKKLHENGKKCEDEVVFDEFVCQSENFGVPVDAKEIFDEAEIPASVEEVISEENPPKPTKKKKKTSSNIIVNYKDLPSGHSLLKKNFLHLESDKKKEKLVKKEKVNQKNVKFKIQLSYKPRNQKVLNSKKTLKSNTKRNTTDKKAKNVIKTTNNEIITGIGLSVPIFDGEEIIKIRKEENLSDSDVEVDILDEDDDNINEINKSNPIIADAINNSGPLLEKCTIETENKEMESRKLPDLTELNDADVQFLTSTEIPKCEYFIDERNITDLEKFIHCEFFEGRTTKTPLRYLKIRNHILNAWKINKPSYVTKTSIRQGLKQCGDVNCISRIHQFLEQIGAINFNCSQTSYVRPLSELIVSPNSGSHNSRKKENHVAVISNKNDNHYRNRIKKRYDGEGGYTYQHDEKGDVIKTTVVNEEKPPQNKQIKRPSVRLIYCRPITNESQCKIKLDLSTLLLMDFHAHTSLSEVMGLVGGYWNEPENVLRVTHYEPCKNLDTSPTHCDMCPVDQAKAIERINGRNLDLLGWFHSHPTFAPEPSQQDVDTQLSMQKCFGSSKPCVGVIITPFSSHGALIASPFRCMVVGRKENFDDQFIPYKLNVEVNDANLRVGEFLEAAKKIYSSMRNLKNSIDFSRVYFQNNEITYLEKFLSSIKMHLAKYSNVNKMNCDAIVQGLTSICNNYSNET